MNGYGSLFERLAGDSARRAGWTHEQAVMDSVATHLQRMLVVRAGSVPTLGDYGLPDLNDLRLSLHDALEQARTAIEAVISRYEPRLEEVRVAALPGGHDPLQLGFSVAAWLRIDDLRRPVHWQLRLQGGSQIRIEPCAVGDLS